MLLLMLSRRESILLDLCPLHIFAYSILYSMDKVSTVLLGFINILLLMGCIQIITSTGSLVTLILCLLLTLLLSALK